MKRILKIGMDVHTTNYTLCAMEPIIGEDDRVFATRVGAKAAELILNEEYGYMVAMRNGETVKVPLEEVAGKLKYVDPNCGLIKEARTIGISFGDEG